MKTLEELAAIREKMKSRIALRGGEGETRVVVGMATCGIAAGARPVLNAFVTEIANAGLDGITVRLSGCAVHDRKLSVHRFIRWQICSHKRRNAHGPCQDRRVRIQ